MKYYLTVDIGGTDIKYGIITYDEELLFSKTRPTNGHLGAHVLTDAVKDLYNEYKDEYKIEGISISTTGGIDDETTSLFPSVTIPNFDNFNFRNELKELGVPISVENDVNSMGLCEKDLVPNNEDMKCIIALTIGTGIGGAIFINNVMHKGFKFTAGEWGKIFMREDMSSYESIASTRALVESAQKVDPSIKDGVEVFKRYDNNDEQIIPLVKEFYNNLTAGLANLVYILNPDHIIIGGGITARGDKFLNEVYESLEDKLLPYFYESLNISLAVHKNNAGMIGAFKNFKLVYNI